VIAPAIVDMKVVPMAAHMFLFYFGLLSMLTPPVAVASMVAAGLAQADMWRTGLIGVWLALPAYLLPFLWVYNPALLLDGSYAAIALVVVTVLIAALLLAQGISRLEAGSLPTRVFGLTLVASSIAVGSATVWFGPENPLALVPAGVGLAIVFAILRMAGDELEGGSSQSAATVRPRTVSPGVTPGQ
jgi:TRAP-type uncharacterized transport system fused permease subunit